MKNLEKLVQTLVRLPNETTWVEFKHNNYDPVMIGERISGLANAATLDDRTVSYMLWGVHDRTHEIVGTDRDLQNIKIGNDELEGWLRQRLSRNVDFKLEFVEIDGKRVGVMSISAAVGFPVSFQKNDFIRFGSVTRKLNEFAEKRGQLWDKLRNSKFETRIAKDELAPAEVVALLDSQAYFDLKGIPYPTSQDGVIHYFLEEGLIVLQDNGLYSITNLGAILFAKKLSDFPTVSRKAIRVVRYNGENKLEMEHEDTGNKGYAIGYEALIKYVSALTPSLEPINVALREKQSAYPAIAIREAVANALIHQDFTVTGAGPLIEIFSNRIEITNPGTPLVDVLRIVDTPPKSRNEKLASLMRQMNMCEEAGSGWDKIVISCEKANLPSPKAVVYEESTKVTLFSKMPFARITNDNKLLACYWHACVKQVQEDQLTNASLRKRFGLPESSAGIVSRLIKDAMDKHYIKPFDPTAGRKYMRYIPIWA